jgi:hypothetical protein
MTNAERARLTIAIALGERSPMLTEAEMVDWHTPDPGTNPAPLEGTDVVDGGYFYWDEPAVLVLQLARTCPWREPCGCTSAQCWRDGGRVRDLKRDCVPCIERLTLRALPSPAARTVDTPGPDRPIG